MLRGSNPAVAVGMIDVSCLCQCALGSLPLCDSPLRIEDLEVPHPASPPPVSPIPEVSPASTLVDHAMNTTLHYPPDQAAAADMGVQATVPSPAPQPVVVAAPQPGVAGEVQGIVRHELRRLMEVNLHTWLQFNSTLPK